MNLFFVLYLVLPYNVLLFAMTAFTMFAGTRAHQDKTAIIMVPGAFHQALVYEKVIKSLKRVRFYDTTAIALPSVGNLVDRNPDIEAVRKVITQKLEERKDVILVGNSYGATVIGEAVKDFKEYSSVYPSNFHGPRHGRILGCMFLSGYIPYISDVVHPETKPDIRDVFWDNDPTKPPTLSFYNALSPSEQPLWVSRLKYSSFAALAANATYIPYTGDFRCIYVIGERDNSVPEAWAKTLIAQEGARWEVERLNADHVPMLSAPDDVAKLIKKFIGEKK